MDNPVGSYLDLEKNQSTVWRQYSVFFIVGIISFCFSIFFLWLFYRKLHLELVPANVVSFILVSAINYLLSIRYVFLRGRFTLLKEVFLFYIIAVLSLALDSAFLLFLVERAEMWYVAAKFITVFSVSIITFVLKKFLVFKK
ncbi:MAG TPA: GtrA family protein [Clostridiales bacterium]|nr:GtrA family protein [Clostridiales bacterium]